MQSLTGREQSAPTFGLLIRNGNRKVHELAVPLRRHAAVSRALQEMTGLGDRAPCKRLASGRLHRNADDGRIALSQSGGDPEEGCPCPYRGNPGVHTAA